MAKATIKILVGFILLSFIGIKYEPEFNEPEFFIKHKPNFRIEYSSPLGESDLILEDLSEEKKLQEIEYREYVGNFYKRDLLDNFSFLIIPLMSLLLLSGIVQLFGMISSITKLKGFMIEYLTNLIWLFVTFTIYWNLNLDGLLLTVIYCCLSLGSIIIIDRTIKPTKPNTVLAPSSLSVSKLKAFT